MRIAVFTKKESDQSRLRRGAWVTNYVREQADDSQTSIDRVRNLRNCNRRVSGFA